jgi:hypothetical protein
MHAGDADADHQVDLAAERVDRDRGLLSRRQVAGPRA